jgi:type I restriction enzyme S subunit
VNKIREGYKVTELGEIPNEWSIMKLSEIAEINPRREVLEDKDTVSFIAMEDITNNGRVINKTDKLYEEVKKGYTPFKDNDVLLAKITPCFENGKRALVGKLSNGIGFGSTEFHVLRANKESISKFLYYVISSHRFMSKAENNMTGSAGQKRVPTEFIKDYVLAVPTIKEQEKIASILSTIDEQIDNVDALIEKNKELKKGLMQTLLTKGIGHTKFKKSDIGEIPEAWELFLLENVTERMIVGLATSVTEYYRESGIPIIRNMNIKNGYFDDSSMLYLDEKFANSMLGKTVKTNDVITVHTGSNIGLTCVVPKEYNEAHTFTTLITTTKRNLLNPEYLMYSINSEYGVNEINRLQVGGGKSNLNVKEFKLYRIAVPPIEEQEKIVSILKEVDKKINKYSKKKQLLEQVKTGLIQQLLTGKIRV